MARQKTAVTLHDVAKRAGVHFSTVSRALNPGTRQLVSAEVVRKVVAAANRLNYRPNEAAVGLKTQRSFQINILLPTFDEPGFGDLVKGVRERFLNTRYVSIIGDEQRLAGQEKFSLRAMKLRPIGGLIVATAMLKDRLVREAANEGIPLVEVLRLSGSPHSSSVIVDYFAAMTDAVALFKSNGHKRIGLISHSKKLSTGVAEAEAFAAALKNAGLSGDGAPHEACENDSIAAGRDAFARLRARHPHLTGIVAAHDRLALGCIDGANAAGLSCPNDISIMGFGDLPLTDRITPPLSTMRIDYGRIGRLAADLMIRAVDDGNAPTLHHTVAPELIHRDSIGLYSDR